jgi:PKD repeat protein
VADASNGAPYYGLVGQDITFDGSLSYDPDPEGYLTSWHWDFGDGTDANGEIVTHKYTSNGTYSVTLTVTDNLGAIDTEIFDVIVTIANNPPKNLVVDGPLTGKQNIEYYYAASAIDIDENDKLRFIFEWGDGTTTTSEEVDSGIPATVSHNWTKYGIYEVKVTAEDNYSAQISTILTVLIDVIVIDDLIKGLIIDEDGNDPFDIFNNSENELITIVEKDTGSYLIDSNGDDKWDYAYDHDQGLITYYEFVYQKYLVIYEAEKPIPGFELITLLAVITLLAILLRRKKKDN